MRRVRPDQPGQRRTRRRRRPGTRRRPGGRRPRRGSATGPRRPGSRSASSARAAAGPAAGRRRAPRRGAVAARVVTPSSCRTGPTRLGDRPSALARWHRADHHSRPARRDPRRRRRRRRGGRPGRGRRRGSASTSASRRRGRPARHPLLRRHAARLPRLALGGHRGPRAARPKTVTVDEVVLLPGDGALLAPDWVPWSGAAAARRPRRRRPAADDRRRRPARPGVPALRRPGGRGGRVRARPGPGPGDVARWAATTPPSAGTPATAARTPPMAAHAPGRCATCGFYLPLAGSLRAVFGVCGNAMSPRRRRGGLAPTPAAARTPRRAVEPVAPAAAAGRRAYDDGVDIERGRPVRHRRAPGPGARRLGRLAGPVPRGRQRRGGPGPRRLPRPAAGRAGPERGRRRGPAPACPAGCGCELVGRTTLRAANTGAPLDAAGVEALATLRASAKRDGRAASAGSASASRPCWRSATSRRCARPRGGVRFSADAHPRARSAAVPALAAELARRGGARAGAAAAVAGRRRAAGGLTTPRSCCRCAPDARRRRRGRRWTALDAELLLALPALAAIDVIAGGACARSPRRSTPRGRGSPTAARTRWQVAAARRRAAGRPARRPAGRGARPRRDWTVTWAVPVDDDGAPGAAAEPARWCTRRRRATSRCRCRRVLLAHVPARPRPPARRARARSPTLLVAAAAGAYADLVAGAAAPTRRCWRWCRGPALAARRARRRPRRRGPRDRRCRDGRPGCRSPARPDRGPLRRPGAARPAPGRRRAGGAGRGAGRRAARACCRRPGPRRVGRGRRSPRSACAGSALAEVGRAGPRASQPPAGLVGARSTPRSRRRRPRGARRAAGAARRRPHRARRRAGVLLPDAGLPVDRLAPLGLRLADPAAPGRRPHPLLERLGAPPGHRGRACSPTPRPRGGRASHGRRDDAEDPDPAVADAVLALVAAAGRQPGELPWLAELALPDADGGLGAGRRAAAARLPAGRGARAGRPVRHGRPRTWSSGTARTRCARSACCDTFAVLGPPRSSSTRTRRPRPRPRGRVDGGGAGPAARAARAAPAGRVRRGPRPRAGRRLGPRAAAAGRRRPDRRRPARRRRARPGARRTTCAGG